MTGVEVTPISGIDLAAAAVVAGSFPGAEQRDLPQGGARLGVEGVYRVVLGRHEDDVVTRRPRSRAARGRAAAHPPCRRPTALRSSPKDAELTFAGVSTDSVRFAPVRPASSRYVVTSVCVVGCTAAESMATSVGARARRASRGGRAVPPPPQSVSAAATIPASSSKSESELSLHRGSIPQPRPGQASTVAERFYARAVSGFPSPLAHAGLGPGRGSNANYSHLLERLGAGSHGDRSPLDRRPPRPSSIGRRRPAMLIRGEE